MLPGETNDQGLQLLVDPGTAWRFSLLGAVNLLCHQLPMPGQNGGGFDRRPHRRQRLLTRLLANSVEPLALLVAQPHATGDLLVQQAILCDQIGVPQQGALGPPRPGLMHRDFQAMPRSPATTASHLDGKYGAFCEGMQGKGPITG